MPPTAPSRNYRIKGSYNYLIVMWFLRKQEGVQISSQMWAAVSTFWDYRQHFCAKTTKGTLRLTMIPVFLKKYQGFLVQ